MKANKKQLAMLVGMALSVTVGVGMNPMDAYAAVSVSYDTTNGYTVSYVNTSGKIVTAINTDASTIATTLKEALSTDAEGGTIDTTEWAGTAASNLLTQMNSFTIKQGATVTLTDSNGTYSITAGNAAATIENVSAKTFNVASSVAKVTASNDATITVADKATIGELEVSGGTVTINKVYSPTGAIITKLSVSNDTTIKGNYAGIAEVNIASGKTATFNTAGSAVAVGTIDGEGDVTVSGGTVALDTWKISSTGNLTVDANNTLTATNEISTASISGGGTIISSTSNVSTTSGDINLGTTGSNQAATVTANDGKGNITAKEVNATTINANTLTLTPNSDLTISSGTYNVTTLKTTANNLSIDDDNAVKNISNIESAGKLTIATGASIKSGANITAKGGLEVTDNAAITVGTFNVSGGELKTTGAITAGSVTLDKNATIALNGTTIKTDFLTMDATVATSDNVKTNGYLNVLNTQGEKLTEVKVTGVTAENLADVKAGVQKATGDTTGNAVVIYTYNDEAAKTDDNASSEVTTANGKLDAINSFAKEDADKLAASDPFTTTLPSASDVNTIANPDATKLGEVTSEASTLQEKINALSSAIESLPKEAEFDKQRAELKANLEKYQKTLDIMSTSGLKAQAAALTAATQQAGKTAAAPGIASARSAAVVTEVLTNNVVARTSELRTVAAAVDEGRPAPDNLWFQYKHTNMDVDGGDVYSKSTVKTNNYQLGYDKKIGENDYLGAYIGTTTGSVGFNGPARSGDADIENSFDFGIYGTHMLPANQYIDYMIHKGKFDTKYSGESWGTTDTGAMIGYGAKIAANEHLTWNPYLQLAYDKVSVDSYMAGANKVNSDDSNNWTAKLGINLMDASGFYGGLAYSRGLSGSYNAYINGVPMPTQDNKANVIYLSLGYRAAMSKTVFLDVSAEKTFADYKGWTAAGKVNFYF